MNSCLTVSSSIPITLKDCQKDDLFKSGDRYVNKLRSWLFLGFCIIRLAWLDRVAQCIIYHASVFCGMVWYTEDFFIN